MGENWQIPGNKKLLLILSVNHRKKIMPDVTKNVQFDFDFFLCKSYVYHFQILTYNFSSQRYSQVNFCLSFGKKLWTLQENYCKNNLIYFLRSKEQRQKRCQSPVPRWGMPLCLASKQNRRNWGGGGGLRGEEKGPFIFWHVR